MNIIPVYFLDVRTENSKESTQLNTSMVGFWNIGEGDARPRTSAKCVSRRMTSEVKGQVKFQVDWIELKLGEGNARLRKSAKCVLRMKPSEIK